MTNRKITPQTETSKKSAKQSIVQGRTASGSPLPLSIPISQLTAACDSLIAAITRSFISLVNLQPMRICTNWS